MWKGDRRIAVEVELHKKGKHRREQIFRDYMKSFDYDEVWYFCGNAEVENQLKPFTKTIEFLKLHHLSDYLSSHVLQEPSR